MRRYILTLAAAIICCSAAAIPSRPSPARLVNDLAEIFTPAQEVELERMLTAFDDSTSNQIAVVTVKDLEGYDASEYATRIGLDWGVGSEKFDNGVVILVKPKTNSPGQVFIAVGYGLEGAIPDAYAKRIIDNEMIPFFRQNDYYGGVHTGCKVLMKLASGEISQLREGDEEEGLYAIAAMLMIICLTVFIVIIVMKKGGKGGNNGSGNGGGRTIYVGPIITTGSSFGGRSSGGFGGGFGGFGGFGGGSFGGGGAGGSW